MSNVADVHLLKVFEALMETRHVTNAAHHVGLSQSAFSHALGRLRLRVGDPLFVRTSRGMEPTERAHALVGPVREAVRHVDAVFDDAAGFASRESDQSFVIRVGDANEYLLLPSLLRELERRAPGVSVVVRHLSPTDTLRGLGEGTIDLAVSAFLKHVKSIRSSRLMDDHMVCAMSRDHRLARGKLTMQRFLELRHLRVVQDASDARFLDEALRTRRIVRNVVATIPHWLVALHTVSSTDMAVMVSERMARRFDVEGRLALRPLPAGGERFSWQLYWHRRHDHHPAQQWMRSLVSELCAAVEAEDPTA